MLARIPRGRAVGGICLGQAVCRLWAHFRAAVHAVVVIEGTGVDTRGIRVQQRAADLFVIGAGAVVMGIVRMLSGRSVEVNSDRGKHVQHTAA